MFAFADAAPSRTVVDAVAADQLRIDVGAERPLADAIDVIAATESGALRVPGKVVLLAQQSS